MSEAAHEYKYFGILSMLFLTIMLGTYVLAYKMVSLAGYTESGGIFIFPINYAIIDIVSEVYGFHAAKKLILRAFICCFLFAIFIPLIAMLPPPVNWPHQAGYEYVLGNVFRFFVANSVGIIIGITINGYLISKWKLLTKGRYFWLRSIGSSSIGELITSIIADIIAFFGTTSFLDLLKLMIAIYAVKFIYALLLAWPSSLIALFLKLNERLSLPVTDFNPFNQSGENLGEQKYAHSA